MNHGGLLLFGLAFVGTGYASEPELSELAVFHRCYSHLTRTRAAATHPLALAVESGQMKAGDACETLLNGAMFGDGGQIRTASNPYAADAKRILRTFNDIHRSWFPSDNLSLVNLTTIDNHVYDSSTPALYITRALFDAQVPYSSVVTSREQVAALRSTNTLSTDFDNAVILKADPKALPSTLTQHLAQAPRPTPTSTDNLIPASQVVRTHVGDLIGVAPYTNSTTIKLMRILWDWDFLSAAEKVGKVQFNEKLTDNLTVRTDSHFGGGVIGSPQYYLLNSGRNRLELADGGLKMSRRWSQSVMNDLLCKNLPALRNSDIASVWTQQKAMGTKLPFRQSRSCLQCHVTIDRMAGVTRNLVSTWAVSSQKAANAVGDRSTHVYRHPSVNAAKVMPEGIIESSPTFYKSEPYGQLLYRGFDGSLVDSREVRGLEPLGAALAGTRDLYACAASRYLFYFTGLAVDLNEMSEDEVSELNPRDREMRSLAIQLGDELKEHQSLNRLVRSILAHPLYRTNTLGRSSQ